MRIRINSAGKYITDDVTLGKIYEGREASGNFIFIDDDGDERGWSMDDFNWDKVEDEEDLDWKIVNEPENLGGMPNFVSTDEADELADLRSALSSTQTFAESVTEITDAIRDLLIEKNAAYGNSALDPVRVFSKASAEEQLLVRIDDKISRIQRGHEYADEDTISDLIGYLVLLKVARRGNSN